MKTCVSETSQTRQRPWGAPLVALGLCLTAMLSACGGGGGSTSASTASSSGSSSTASTSGIVTGFGSVYVNGEKLEDAKASTLVYNADGTTINTALRLGQRVRAEHDGNGTASRVVVDAAVIGTVSSVNSASATFKVAGQTVKSNADSAAGPVTVFAGGYSSITDVTANDLVEVHGTPVYDSSAKVYAVQATRIEKMTSITAVRVTGALSALNADSKTFSLNGLTVGYGSATLLPTGASLSNGENVIVWANKTWVSGSSLSATGVRVVTGSGSDLGTTTQAKLAGVVSLYDASAGTFQAAGVNVKVNSSTTIQPSGKSVVNNAYVQVAGSLQSDGSLLATSIGIRQSDTVDDTARIRLSGAISGFTNTTSFVVRGVPVDASASGALQTSCSGITLADGVVVDVVATAQSGTDVVLASSVNCRGTAPTAGSLTIAEVQGAASNVKTSSKTFTLTKTGSTSTQNVSWTDQTAWSSGLSASTLASQTSIDVEGYIDSSNVLVAREIRVPGSRDSDAYSKASLNGTATGWGRYRARR